MYYFNNQDLRPRHYLNQNKLWLSPTPAPPMGGWGMNRNYSDQSSTSTRSRSSGDCYSPISSIPSMSYVLNNSQSPQNYDDGYSQGYRSHTTVSSDLESHRSSMKSTPSSLGWSPETELLRLYKLIVPRGKEPYLELLPGYKACYNTPQKVFLDPPSYPERGVYPCRFPIRCPGKQFRRPADLERHYRHVHADADQKASFPCDYKPCIRSRDPFTRKDHYRDHLKDFHKEDVGTAKQPKNAKDPHEWQAAQQAWLEERQIDPRWWRCRRCLQRVYVETNGYKCTTCNEECTKDRIEAREQKRREVDKYQRKYSGQNMDMTYLAQCKSCNGNMWITDGAFAEGNSVPCPICMPSDEIVYEVAEWEEDARFDMSYKTAY